MLDKPEAADSGQVSIHLRAGLRASTDLATRSLSLADLQAGEPLVLQFEPLRDSKKQTYYFFLASRDSAPGGAATARYSPLAVLDGASAIVDGLPVEGNLQFESFFSLRTRDRIDLLLTRMSQGRPYLLGAKGFYVALGAIYLVLLVAFLWRVAQALLETEE
jgi:hypothetical protein